MTETKAEKEPSPEALEAAPWCRDAWFVLTTVGDGEATTLHYGWTAICDAVVGVHYHEPDHDQRKEVMTWFLDWEEWSNAPDGFPWRWDKHHEDGSVIVWRVTDALALDAFRREGVEKERERCANIAHDGARLVRDGDIKFVTPAKYAADLADDIADGIESGTEP